VNALAFALGFASTIAGALAWRWMSLTVAPKSVTADLDPAKVSAMATKISEHESKLNALMLERGLRTSKESRA
jgi:hypothetical protein